MPQKDTLNTIMTFQALEKDGDRHRRDKAALYLDVAQQRAILDRFTGRLSEIAAQKVETQKAADALELKNREDEETIAKFQTQLNITRHQGEYDTIRQFILSHKADVEKQEEEELELLQRVDDLVRERADTEQEATAQRHTLQQLEQEVAQQAAQYDTQVAEIEQKKQETARRIDERVLEAYRRVARERGDTALVMMRNRICQGCFTTVTKQTENELLHDEEVVYCQSCGRILMLTEEEGPGPAAQQA